MGERGKRFVTIQLDEDLYKRLVELSEKEGFPSLSEFIVKVLSERAGAARPAIDEALRQRVLRMVQDEINRHMQALETLKRQVAELYERVDAIQAALEGMKEKRAEEARPGRRERKTGIERLREEGVVFESGLPPRLNKDAFFSYLKREGAIVIATSKERIAVDPGFWSDFEEKLFRRASTSSEEELKRLLGEKGYMLFAKLRDDGLVIFDPGAKKWKPVGQLAG